MKVYKWILKYKATIIPIIAALFNFIPFHIVSESFTLLLWTLIWTILFGILEQLNTLDFNKVIQYLREICIQLELVDKNYQTEQMENWYRTWKGIILGMNSFSVHKINAPIFLYHAKEGDYKGNEWEQYSRQVKTIDIPGDHYSILKDSNVKVLSKYIARKLEETNECRTN
ncbi:thioesterase domain-containing protein [Limosilactobacillus reuteri]|uniref:thioesterase domain-containing protein n=1 Tax=Limosilactobacillus reuteri TaxID=1598 RepID=UPI0021D39BFC|nr:hypothetical protein [Limosilactobacillus reuteri]MCU4692888.1 hypothetical protein [Limosilactobacillus reuteri]